MGKNKVRFGFSNVHIAFATDEFDQGKPLYEKPIRIYGSVGLTLNFSGNEDKFNADNTLYYTGQQDNGFTGDIEVAEFPNEVLAKIFGYTIDKYGGTLEVSNGIPRNFALGGQVDGDVYNSRFWMYNCTGSVPNESYKTTGESKDITTQTMSLTVVPMDLGNGTQIKKYRICREGKGIELYDTFFEKVYIPNLTETEKSDLKSRSTKNTAIGG